MCRRCVEVVPVVVGALGVVSKRMDSWLDKMSISCIIIMTIIIIIIIIIIITIIVIIIINNRVVATTRQGRETSRKIRFMKGLPQGDALCPFRCTLCLNPVA